MRRNTELRSVSALSVCRRRLARHPTQVFVVVVPFALAVLTATVLGPLLLFVVAEAVLLGLLPSLPSIRRRVHEHMAREARAAKLADRARLMPAIAQGHRMEMEELESIVEAIRTRTGCALDREDWLGLDGLLTLYLRLALAHRKSTEAAFSSAATSDIERLIAVAQHARNLAPPAAKPRVDQHVVILERRRALKATMEERRAVLSCDLAAVADMIRCLYEECVAADGATASGEVPEAIEEAMRGAAAVSELAMLRASLVDELDVVDAVGVAGVAGVVVPPARESGIRVSGETSGPVPGGAFAGPPERGVKTPVDPGRQPAL
jgi:hypothetical protein